jgi:hypothetical protein
VSPRPDARALTHPTLYTLLDAAAPCAEAESMKRLSLLSLLVCAAALAMAGCGKEPSTAPGTSANDASSQTFSTMMNQEPALSEGDTYESPGQSDFSAASGGVSTDAFSTQEAIHPVYYFRVIRDRSRTLDIHVEEDSNKVRATVNVLEHFAGSFNIVVADTTDSGVVRRVIKKPLQDDGRFRAVFVRFKRPSPGDADAPDMPVLSMADWGMWRLAAISSHRIHSPENTAQILSVRLQTASGFDTTLDDPSQLFRFPRGLLRVGANEKVTITVKTADPTNAVFVLAGWGHMRLAASTEGFTGSFRAPYELRLFRIGVNALAHGTLFDDQAPYDSDFWGIPARTVPPLTASN